MFGTVSRQTDRCRSAQTLLQKGVRLQTGVSLAVERLVLDTADLRNCPRRRLAVERLVLDTANLLESREIVNCGMQNTKSRSRLQLPHNFAMPKMELQPSDKKFARIRWKQRGTYVAEQRMHLKQFNETRSQTQVVSQYVRFAATRRKYDALVTLLQNGTSWLNMYQTTVTACGELSSSRGREELAVAAGLTYQMDVFFFWRAVFCEAQEKTQTCTA